LPASYPNPKPPTGAEITDLCAVLFSATAAPGLQRKRALVDLTTPGINGNYFELPVSLPQHSGR
jgi:hypothetical protein